VHAMALHEVPIGHALQTCWPVVSWKVPGLQRAHWWLPVPGATVPAAQAGQLFAAPTALAVPIAQGLHTPAPAAEYLPAVHALQAYAPAEDQRPAGQLLHCFAL